MLMVDQSIIAEIGDRGPNQMEQPRLQLTS